MFIEASQCTACHSSRKSVQRQKKTTVLPATVELTCRQHCLPNAVCDGNMFIMRSRPVYFGKFMFNVSGKELLRRRNGDTELHERIVSGERGNGNNCDRLLSYAFRLRRSIMQNRINSCCQFFRPLPRITQPI